MILHYCFVPAVVALALAIAAIIALAVAVGFTASLERRSSASGNDTDLEVCLTPSCVEAAAFILQNIDTDVDPCADFYNFTCGKWAMKNNVPEGME